jgi:hypothetical protein
MLSAAGIRFTLFSTESESSNKAFVSKLGLPAVRIFWELIYSHDSVVSASFTSLKLYQDWNCCISLKETYPSDVEEDPIKKRQAATVGPGKYRSHHELCCAATSRIVGKVKQKEKKKMCSVHVLTVL